MNVFRMIIIFLFFIALNVYVFIRGWQALPNITIVHTIYTILFLVCSTSVFIAVFVGKKLPLWVAHIFDLAGGYYIMLFIFLVMAALLADLLRLTHHYFQILPDWVTANYEQVKLLYLLAIFCVLVLISLIGYVRFANPKITELTIPMNKGIGNAEKITIVAASDIHLGNLIRKNRLAKWVDLINAQQPDLILLAGDLFDHNMKAVESQDMDKELLRLNARYGVYAVPGNHDYYAGIDNTIRYMKKSGIHVLRDQELTIDYKLVLIGRDDFTNKNRKPLKSLMVGVNAKFPVIVVDHQPSGISESIENKVDLHISGHTHNGQIFPFNHIISHIYEHGYGYRKTGNTHCYVSSGLGLWGALIRFGTRSEIVKIVIQLK